VEQTNEATQIFERDLFQFAKDYFLHLKNQETAIGLSYFKKKGIYK
jgi:hypothetical protein